MKVSFSLWQRLSLEGVIQQQKSTDGRDYLTLVDLWRKIAVPDFIRKDYTGSVCNACGVGRIWNREKIDLAAPLEVDLEKAEARKALEILQGYKTYSVVDSEWLLPIKAILNQVTGDENPAAAPAPAAGVPAGRGPRGRGAN